MLERAEESFCFPRRCLTQVLLAPKLELKGEFTNERSVVASGAPKGNIAEVNDADVLQHFLDDRAGDDFYFIRPALF
jgi:hypothetical protein